MQKVLKMSDSSSVNDTTYAFPYPKQLEVDPNQTAMKFRCKTDWIPKYRLLIFPCIDFLLTFFFLYNIEPFIQDGESDVIDYAPWALLIALLLRTWFLLLDLKYWFNVILRNSTSYRTVTEEFTIPVDRYTGQIDFTSPLILDSSRHAASEVKEIVITGRVIPKQKNAGVFYGYRKKVYLGDKTKQIPSTWVAASRDHIPIFAPTLILENEAHQLYETRDFWEAVEFTRYLRHSFGFKGLMTVFGMYPFQIEGLVTWETVLYPTISAIAMTGLAIFEGLLTRTEHSSLILFIVPAFYALQVGLMALCSRTMKQKAVTMSLNKLVWMHSQIAARKKKDGIVEGMG
jgi:hypothetical protein